MKLLVFILIFTHLLASSRAEVLMKKLELSASSKAMIQWARVFKSKKKMKRYKIDSLSDEDKALLKEYLLNHAIDSDQPTIAGV